jgi:acetyltransferase-like isoleucine patch superfamily enzyme
MRSALESLCWLLPPSSFKNSILRRFGHDISATASIGPIVVVGVARFEIGDSAQIWPFNLFRDLSLVRLGDFAAIKSWNWISAAPEFQAIDPNAGTLNMEFGAGIGARNYLDCSGLITVSSYANVGGHRTFLQTHEPDLENRQQTAGRIVIGHHSLVASCSVVLKGAHLPAQSVLAANSTMVAASATEQRRGVYAGSPAAWKGETRGHWFERTEHVMTNHIVDSPMGPESGRPAIG